MIPGQYTLAWYHECPLLPSACILYPVILFNGIIDEDNVLYTSIAKNML